MPFAYQPLTSAGPIEIIMAMRRGLQYASACEYAREECLVLRKERPSIIGFRLWRELSSRKGYVLHGVPYILGKSDLPPRRSSIPQVKELHHGI